MASTTIGDPAFSVTQSYSKKDQIAKQRMSFINLSALETKDSHQEDTHKGPASQEEGNSAEPLTF